MGLDTKATNSERFEYAKSLFDRGNYVSSQEVCEIMNALLPNNMNILLLLSASYYMQKKYDKSLEILHKVPEKYSRSAEVLNNIAANYFQKNDFPKSYNYYRLAIREKPNLIECWLGFIILLLKMDNYKITIRVLNIIIHYKPNLPKIYNLYGRLLIKLNKFQDAGDYFQRAIQLDPKSDSSWAGLGDSFAFNKKFNSAIICYEKALQFNRSSINLHINIGFMYYQLKQFDKSSFYLKTAIQMSPRINFDILHILCRAYFFNGNITAAMKTYSLYLKNQSNNPVVLNDMGLIYLHHFHNITAAEPCFEMCVDLHKRNPLYYKCLISVYKQIGRKDIGFKIATQCADIHFLQNDFIGGISALQYAVNLFPENYYPHWKTGLMFYNLKLDHKALLRYIDAKRMKQNVPLIFTSFAFIHEKKNELEEAEQFYRKSLQLYPKNYDAIRNLMDIKQQEGNTDDVITLFHLLLYHFPDNFEILNDLANYFYIEINNPKAAFNYFKKALKICDTDFNTYLALGTLSLELNNINAALNHFLKVLELFPDCLTAHLYIGFIYKEKKQFNEAINKFKKVLNLHPNHPDACCFLNLCQRYICKFTNFNGIYLNKLKDIVLHQLTNNEVPSISLQHSLLFNFESEVLIKIASTFAKQFVDKPYIQRRLSQGYVHDITVSNNCIRIGYIYMDCSSHPTTELVKFISKSHDGNKFEIFCYSLTPINRLRSNNSYAADCFIDISNLSSIDAAKKINADRIHILIDVGDSTKDLEYEIFALKPAPIQVKLLGHPGTSGATFIDYLITDKECSPPDLDYLYTEKLVYLNRTVFFGDHMLLFNDLSQRNPRNRTTNRNNCNETIGSFDSHNTSYMYSLQMFPDGFIKHYTRQMYNLPEDSIVYCYFGQLYKIDQTTLNMWTKILKGVKNSVLWLLRFVKDTENNIHEYFEYNGIDPVRIIFSNIAPKAEHLRRIQLADVYLDTPFYNGHKSCLDALWAGTPIVTLSGDTFVSRMTTSQLLAVNCQELIAFNEVDYTRIAIKLGKHTHLLDQKRQQIWQSKTTSLLFDCESYCRELENLYLDMWKKLF
ncbi:O-GlcNAc transferase, C-terminal,Tetratricopeptide repeat,Tetratricopeptide repeat- [Cinara cedri]|uniref:protein O-GlcNAc transferase n=1 Tax=Cinara cedri TaxID=506608 RepID=A0A5E4NLF5_9HEMI|nr:O-GlcNAc transferase, C-terminal,Tetratricopeptide repeat,Tetratricopeptide repeat- [Cinara cedri]